MLFPLHAGFEPTLPRWLSACWKGHYISYDTICIIVLIRFVNTGLYLSPFYLTIYLFLYRSIYLSIFPSVPLAPSRDTLLFFRLSLLSVLF